MDELEKIMVDALKKVRTFSFNGVTLKESEVIKVLSKHSSKSGRCINCPLFNVPHCQKIMASTALQLLTERERKIQLYKRHINIFYGKGVNYDNIKG